MALVEHKQMVLLIQVVEVAVAHHKEACLYQHLAAQVLSY